MKGFGFVYRPKYRHGDGEWKESATWWFQYSRHGKRFRESSGETSKARAEKALKRRFAEIAQGRPAGPDVERTTLDELAEILRNDYRANGRRSTRRIGFALNHLGAYFGGDCRALTITSDRVTAYITYRQDEGAASGTINRELAALKRAFRLAKKNRKAAEVPDISLLQEGNARKGFFEPEQFQAVLRQLPEEIRPVAEVAYITGWRVHSELLTRQKHHVDLNAGWFRLDPNESKNGEGRMFPLTAALREVLTRQLERTRAIERATGRIIPWLFHRNGRPIKDFRGAWKQSCADAGVPGRIPHDFRRTAVRNLERAGVPRSAAMKMVGHRTEAIYRRYAIVDEATLKESALKLDALASGSDHVNDRVSQSGA
jgi:integrase